MTLKPPNHSPEYAMHKFEDIMSIEGGFDKLEPNQ